MEGFYDGDTAWKGGPQSCSRMEMSSSYSGNEPGSGFFPQSFQIRVQTSWRLDFHLWKHKAEKPVKTLGFPTVSTKGIKENHEKQAVLFKATKALPSLGARRFHLGWMHSLCGSQARWILLAPEELWGTYQCPDHTLKVSELIGWDKSWS